jgi:hypothetical protein
MDIAAPPLLVMRWIAVCDICRIISVNKSDASGTVAEISTLSITGT